MARFGYARVSTTDQNPELQINALQGKGECSQIFTDHGVSGTKASRPQLDKMLEHLREGDEVVVWKLDRLGRDTRNLLELLAALKDKGVKFRSLEDGISTDPADKIGAAMADAMVTIISAFAQLERDTLSERTKAGMAVASANGRKAGRKEVVATDPNVVTAKELKAKGLPIEQIQGALTYKDKKGKDVKPSRATVYRYLAM